MAVRFAVPVTAGDHRGMVRHCLRRRRLALRYHSSQYCRSRCHCHCSGLVLALVSCRPRPL